MHLREGAEAGRDAIDDFSSLHGREDDLAGGIDPGENLLAQARPGAVGDGYDVADAKRATESY